MADISTYLNEIQSAVYGEEVRSSIINALKKVNEDNESYAAIKESVTELAATAQSYAVGGTGSRDGEDEDNSKFYSKLALDALASIAGRVVAARESIDAYVSEKEAELKGDTGNAYFAAFKVVNGHLLMYSDPDVDKVRFYREGEPIEV